MTGKDFDRQLAKLSACVANVAQVENARVSGLNVFQYAAVCEHLFEQRLADLTGRERISTFYADLSIAEFFGLDGVLDTCKNVCRHWRDSVEMFSEFVLCVNWKAWEHAGRNNDNWAQAYSQLYYAIDELISQYYADDAEKADYYFQYMD